MAFAPKTFLLSFLGMRSSGSAKAVFSAGIQFSFTLWGEKKVNLTIIIIIFLLSIARQPCRPKESS